MRRQFVLVLALLLTIFSLSPARADNDPSAGVQLLTNLTRARQHRGKSRVIAGSVLIAYGLAAMVVGGIGAGIGFYDREHDRSRFGEDGDIFGLMFLSYGAMEGVICTSIGTGLVVAGQHDLKGLPIAEVRF